MGDEDKNQRGVCRDYERGVCNRGNCCKFYHSPDVSQPDKKLPICKDFQNKGCDRAKCRFLHVTAEEEAHYNETGILPEHGGKPESVGAGRGFGGPPRGGGRGGMGGGRGGFGGGGGRRDADRDVCKDFLNNICTRGNSCKFRHATENELYLERQLQAATGGISHVAPPRDTMGDPYGKRRRTDESDMLTEENEMLRRKITDLQRQVLDLRQMNDTLYDQNTRYRNQLRGVPTTPASSTMQAPAADPYGRTKASPPPMHYDGYTKF